MFEFRARRELTDPASLTTIEREQVTACTVRYFGRAMPFDHLFADITKNLFVDFEHSWLGFLERWEVFDEEGVHRYDAFFYNVDSGCIFHEGTTELAAQVIQFVIEGRDETDQDVLDALADAWAQASSTPG